MVPWLHRWLPALLNCEDKKEAVRREGGPLLLQPRPCPERPQALTVCGDIYFFRELGHIHFKPVLNVIKDFGIIFIRYKGDCQALGTKATSTSHLQRDGVRSQALLRI